MRMHAKKPAQKAYLTFGTSRLLFRFGCLSNPTQRELY